MRVKKLFVSAVMAGCFAAGCAGAPQSGYQYDDGYPPRGGYEEQMRQEQSRRNQEAAGEMLPILLDIQDMLIQQENMGR